MYKTGTLCTVRCDERLQSKTKEFTRLTYTGSCLLIDKARVKDKKKVCLLLIDKAREMCTLTFVVVYYKSKSRDKESI